MEPSHIGSDLLGPTESRVLAALARLADPVSGRQLTKLTGVDSNASVQRYLAKLRGMGLVLATETPSAIFYRLNREHVYWQPIEDILASPARIDEAIIRLVQDMLGADARVAVFGSVAEGTAGAESDYDLLLVVDDSVPGALRTDTAAALADLVGRLTGNECQVVDVSETELRDLVAHKSPLAREWQKHARPIDGRGRIPQLQSNA